MKLYTSRFHDRRWWNPKTLDGKAMVSIALVTPKDRLPYAVDGRIELLAPSNGIKAIAKREVFVEVYCSRLNKVGVPTIRAEFERLRQSSKQDELVLFCWCDLSKEECWCHRTVFAEWWEKETGEKIEELTSERVKPYATQLALF